MWLWLRHVEALGEALHSLTQRFYLGVALHEARESSQLWAGRFLEAQRDLNGL